ncbi:MAG: peptidoglycan-binding protein [Deltaproteobacteria bacterium]|nr:peptidoglycan-binding protein [Deltaproteobacteria bacterium]
MPAVGNSAPGMPPAQVAAPPALPLPWETVSGEAFAVGETVCRPPAAGGGALDTGAICWCIREYARLDSGAPYVLTEAEALEWRGRQDTVIGLCREAWDIEGAYRDAYATLAAFGLGILAEDLRRVRERNPGLVTTAPDPPPGPGGRRHDVREAQTILNLLGFGPLVVDGRFGPSTSASIRAFQETVGVRATGKLDGEAQRLLRNSIMFPSFAQFPLNDD